MTAVAGRRSLFAALALLATMLLVAGCGGGGKDRKAASGRFATIRAGTLTVGSDIPYPPFEFGRPPYEGFDVDVVNEVAKRLDLEARIEKGPFETILRGLGQSRYDLVASAVPITGDRRKTVDFSEPYFPAEQSLMVKKGSDIKTVSDLSGKRVGAQLGTTGAEYANKETNAAVRTYQQIDDALNALEAGQVDAVVHDFAITKFAERSRKALVVVQAIPTGEQYGLAFAKGRTGLRQAVNTALEQMKKDGTYARIYRKWLRSDPPDSILSTNS